MKIISFRDGDGQSFGVADDDGGIVDIGRKGPYPSLRDALTADGLDEVAALAAGAAPDTTLDAVTLLPVIPDPDKIVCAGMNYKDHVEEFDREMPENVTLFVRLTNTLVAHGDDIVRPTVSDNFDFEGELSLIIGKGGRHIAEADVLSHISGYTCFLDASVRDYQGHSVTAGKNFHRTGPLGPWMVTTDEIPDPQVLDIRTYVNGECKQRNNTRQMLCPVASIIEYIAAIITLEPGDIISTGTVSGVGATTGQFLQPGDIVEIEISRIGTLHNKISASKK